MMALNCASGLQLPPIWLSCWVQLLLIPQGPWLVQALNLCSSHLTVYMGPDCSYFGFSMDFLQASNGRWVMGQGWAHLYSAPRTIEA